jgi:hypothetical protein
MRMGDVSEEDLVGRISEDLALGRNTEGEAVSNVITAYMRWSCPSYGTDERSRTWSAVYTWLESLSSGQPISPQDPFVPEVLKAGSEEAQAAWLRGAFDRLRRCA